MRDAVQFNHHQKMSRREFMTRMAVLGASVAVAPSFFTEKALGSQSDETLAALTRGIVWTGQASVKIPGLGANVYVDPYKVKTQDKADLVMITHSHDDHLSSSSLEKICHNQTTIIAPADVASKMKRIPQKETLVVKPGDKVTVNNLTVEAVPMYNVKKTQCHPKSKNWVGYVITGNGVSVYHAGDTERIPEMDQIHCDIALLPLGQKYTMNSVEEAAESARAVHAKIAVPIHFGIYEGSQKDAVKFKDLLSGQMEVVILERSN